MGRHHHGHLPRRLRPRWIPSIPAGALVIGSWLGFALALVYSLLMLRRVWFEDGFLRANLEGYADYTSRVRYRLVPGLW